MPEGYIENRLGVLWNPETGELDAESVKAYEKRTKTDYKTGRQLS